MNSPFHLFDIRGKYPPEVNTDLFSKVACGLISLYSPEIVVLGRDNRNSSSKLQESLVSAFIAGGVTVIDIGETSTPLFYFSVIQAKADLGLMVTASHLPPDENGLKIVKKGALPLDEKEISGLRNNLGDNGGRAQGSPLQNTGNTKTGNRGLAVKKSFEDRYIENVLCFGDNVKNMVIAIDCRNSIVGKYAREIFLRLPVNAIFIHEKNSMPADLSSLNPLDFEAQTDIKNTILENRADLGVMFDGDGDRCIFFDRSGEMIPVSFVLGMLGSLYNKIAIDTRAGLVVRDMVKNSGGQVVVVPAWAQNLKFAMAEDPEILFAGETSGHLIFRDFFPIDDGLFAALRFLSLISKDNYSLKNTLTELSNTYFELPEENIKIEKNPIQLLDKIADYYRAKDFEVSIMDGVTIIGESTHINLRPSLSEPFLRLNIEARSKEEAERTREEILNLLRNN